MVNKLRLSVALTLLSVALPINTQASDWGCQCLLCLADPRGPTTESECKPPIKKLWRHLAKGKPFPTCNLVGGSSGSYANISSSTYGLCPNEYSALGKGQYAFRTADYQRSGVGIPYFIGSGDSSSKQTEPVVCVKGLEGSKDITIPIQDASPITALNLQQQSVTALTISKNQSGWGSVQSRTIKAAAYSDIQVLPYSGQMIDVVIDGSLNQRVPVGM